MDVWRQISKGGIFGADVTTPPSPAALLPWVPSSHPSVPPGGLVLGPLPLVGDRPTIHAENHTAEGGVPPPPPPL